MPHLLTATSESRLLRDLERLLGPIVGKLAEREQWEGYAVVDPDDGQGYDRLVCRDEVAMSADGTRYVVAVHAFPPGGVRTPMHDHRYPLAVLPFDARGAVGVPAYRMPWEVRANGAILAGGVADVRTGEPYAIENHRFVFHAVHSTEAHQSLVLVDVTHPPARVDRLSSRPLDAARSEALRLLALSALGLLTRATGGRLPGNPVRQPWDAGHLTGVAPRA